MSESNPSTPTTTPTPAIIQDQLRNFTRTSSFSTNPTPIATWPSTPAIVGDQIQSFTRISIFIPNPNGIHRELDPTRNLPQAPLSSLPPDSPDCPICTNPYDIPPPNSETPLTLPCGHIFGRTCLRSWIKENQARWSSVTCPLCRAIIPVAPSLTPRNPQLPRGFVRLLRIAWQPSSPDLGPEAIRQEQDRFITRLSTAVRTDLIALGQRAVENGGVVPPYTATDPTYAELNEAERATFQERMREVVALELEDTRLRDEEAGGRRSTPSTRPTGSDDRLFAPYLRRITAQHVGVSPLSASTPLPASSQPREQAQGVFRDPTLQVNIHRGSLAPGPRFPASTQGPPSSRVELDAQQASRDLNIQATPSPDLETVAPTPRTVPSSSLRQVLESRREPVPPTQPTEGVGSSTWWTNIGQTINRAWQTENSASRPPSPPNTTRAQSPSSILSTPPEQQGQAELPALMKQLHQGFENAREAAERVREQDRRVWEAEGEVVRASEAVRRAQRDVRVAREALEEFDRGREEGDGGEVVRRRQFGPDN